MSTSNSSSNEKFIFKCNRQAANVSEKLLSFYKDNEFFDIVLIAGSDSIKLQAHRIVLSALSEYFLDIFRANQNEYKNNEVELNEIEAPTLRMIIDFMYSGWIELSLETVKNILKTAAFLKMKTLVDGCSDFIETKINSSNCLNWFHIAKELSLSGLKEKSLNCIYNHFEEISKGEEIMCLNEEELKDLLFIGNPHQGFEEHVFLSMVAWIKYDKLKREKLTFELLSMVRYQFLTPKFIIENRKAVCKTVESYELICSWLQWHLSPETRSVDQQICGSKPRKLESKLTAISYSDAYELKIQTYNPEKDSWTIDKEALLPIKKRNFSRIVIDDKLIVVGGVTNQTVTNSVECLDLRTLKWIDLPPMQQARFRCELVNLNGNLCVYGGFKNNTHTGSVNSFEIYDFSTCKWNNIELPMILPINRRKITVHNGILYIVDLHNGDLQSFDVSSNKWGLQRFMKKNINDFSIAAVDRYLYAIGTYYFRLSFRTVGRRYDLFTGTWTDVALMSKAQFPLKTLVFENKIVVVHGGRPGTCRIEEYNTESGTWTQLSDLENITFDGVCLCNNQLEL